MSQHNDVFYKMSIHGMNAGKVGNDEVKQAPIHGRKLQKEGTAEAAPLPFCFS